MKRTLNVEKIQEVSENFLADKKELDKVISSKKDKKYTNNVGAGMRLIKATKSTKLHRFLHRDHLTVRIPLWIIQKAMLTAKDKGLTTYIEELLVKDLKLKQTKKELETIINENTIQSKR